VVDIEVFDVTGFKVVDVVEVEVVGGPVTKVEFAGNGPCNFNGSKVLDQ